MMEVTAPEPDCETRMSQTPEIATASAQTPAGQPASPPTLSVVLPNYNHGRLIARAIAALVAQERPPDEIIIVDDGSTDDSLQVIEQLAASSSIIRVIANPTNEGAPAALSRGLDACRGKYVYFAAADDSVLPGFFANALAVLEQYPEAGLICGESELVSGHTGKRMGVRPAVRPSNRTTHFTPAATAALLKRADNWILTGSSIFVRDRAVGAGGFATELGSFADGYLGRKVALTHGFCFIPRAMAIWRVFDDSFSRETASDPIVAQRVLANACTRFAQDPAFPAWYGELFTRRLQFSIARVAVSPRPINKAILVQTSMRAPADRMILSVVSRLPAAEPVRSIVLAWLWLRFRPMSPWLVLRSAIWRCLMRPRHQLPGGARGPA
jgi:glycosyltransferase involved in cell wall biosynthesis